MSDSLFPVPEEWKKRAFMTAAQYEAAYAESLRDPDGFWGKEAARLDWVKPFTKVKNVSWDPDNLSHQMVRGRRAERLGQLHRPASGQARRPDRHHLGRRRSRGQQAHHLSSNCTTKSANSPMC